MNYEIQLIQAILLTIQFITKLLSIGLIVLGFWLSHEPSHQLIGIVFSVWGAINISLSTLFIACILKKRFILFCATMSAFGCFLFVVCIFNVHGYSIIWFLLNLFQLTLFMRFHTLVEWEREEDPMKQCLVAQ